MKHSGSTVHVRRKTALLLSICSISQKSIRCNYSLQFPLVVMHRSYVYHFLVVCGSVEVWKCVGIHMHIPKVLQFTGVLQINHSTFWYRLGLYLGLRTSVAKLTLVLVGHQDWTDLAKN